eukprot:XP_001708436.1 Hypothetical protein GL50803_137674 [Giardia lamblia ATCC 50803]
MLKDAGLHTYDMACELGAEDLVRGLGCLTAYRAIISWLYQSEYWTACGMSDASRFEMFRSSARKTLSAGPMLAAHSSSNASRVLSSSPYAVSSISVTTSLSARTFRGVRIEAREPSAPRRCPRTVSPRLAAITSSTKLGPRFFPATSLCIVARSLTATIRSDSNPFCWTSLSTTRRASIVSGENARYTVWLVQPGRSLHNGRRGRVPSPRPLLGLCSLSSNEKKRATAAITTTGMTIMQM